MTEEQIVQKICEIMEINYSHYDNHKMTINYFPHHNLKFIPKIVVYSSKYGPWEFSILEDMSVITPLSPFLDTIISITDDYNELNLSDKLMDNYNKCIKLKKTIKLCEQFLKENNCASIINDENKKINWE